MRYKSLIIILTILLNISFCSDEKKSKKIDNIKQAKPMIQNVKILAMASSQNYNKNDNPLKLFDQSSNTAWIVKGSNQGLGENFEIILSEEILFNKLIIQQIKHKSVNRVKKLLLSYEGQYSNGTKEVFLSDKDNAQIVSFDEMLSAKKLSFNIQEIYSSNSTKSENSALAELALFYNDDRIMIKDWQETERLLLSKKTVESENKISPGKLTEIKIRKIYESSFKVDDKKNNLIFKASNLIDKNPKTVWIEGQLDEGIKEYIQFELLEKNFHLRGISIINGYALNNKLFKKYNRIKELAIELGLDKENGQIEYLPEIRLALKDTIKPQFLPLNIEVKKNVNQIKGVFITLTIHSVYYGSNAKETALSEVVFFK